MVINCQYCGKAFKTYPAWVRKGCGKHCSRECNNIARMKRESGTCLICGKPFERKVSQLGKYCSNACVGEANRGAGNPSWKGGVSYSNNIRKCAEHTVWRKAVYGRDQYKCQDCGQIGWSLEPHHVFSWAEFPDLRFEVWNGETLCVKCHRERHKGKRQPINAAAGRLF